ncbi:MAG: hypothetical protein GX348_04515 [Veillonellaceae bacterium]|nr:hypothetical protein [Veillonellaceae bacterium]
MSVIGRIKWKICLKCGRKFLAAAPKTDPNSWTSECPKCRTEMMRKLLGDITAKMAEK